MSYTIGKRFDFSASHALSHLPADHPCHRTHGHNYIVGVELTGDVDVEDGMVMDYRDLAFVKTFLDTEFDHRHLNDVLPADMVPTAECLARYIFWRIVEAGLLPGNVRALAVTVQETPKTFARFGADLLRA